MSEAEVISILGEPTSKAMSDTPGLYWCCGNDTLEQWDDGDVYCGHTMFQIAATATLSNCHTDQFENRKIARLTPDPVT
ncbi:MAG: hypothetical protein ABL999_19655, partial [Pyrinomonadaceae bacterium]